MSYLIFIVLLIVPGYLVLLLFQPYKWCATKVIVFSIALSLLSIMAWGLFTNTITPLFGYKEPLSRVSLTISFSVLVVLLAVFNYYRKSKLLYIALHFKSKLHTFMPIIFPIMSIAGISVMNNTGNNVLLLVLLISIPLYVVYLFTQRKKIPEHVYLVSLLCIGASLLLLVPLRNQFIMGVDVHREYSLFEMANYSHIWLVYPSDQLSSCLSTNLLPTIFQTLTGMNPIYVFKGLLFVAMLGTPFVVYSIARMYIGYIGAFIAGFFVMAQISFLSIGGGRTEFAVFYFALMLLVLLDNEIGKRNKLMLFMFFGAGLIFSHYTTAFIAMFLLILAWFINYGMSKWYKSPHTSFPVLYLLVYIIPLYLWENLITKTSWTGMVETIIHSLQSISSVTSVGVRSDWVDAALGVGFGNKSIIQQFEFIASWLPIVVIVVVLLIMVLLRKHIFSPLYLSLTLASVGVMAVATILPNLSVSYDIGRTYYQVVPLFAPLFGLVVMANKQWLRVTTLLFLVTFYLFTSNVAYQFTGHPRGLILNSSGEYYERYFIK